MKSRIISFEPEVEAIIRKCQYCSLSMIDAEGKPYVIHMNFGLRNKTVYFHSGPEGKKLQALANNPNVCIAFSTDHLLRWQNSDVACSYSMKYRSVLIHGSVKFIENPEEKMDALNVIMKQYTDEDYKYSAPAVENVCVFSVDAEIVEGRAYGY